MKIKKQKFHLALRFGDLGEHLTLRHYGRMGLDQLVTQLTRLDQKMRDCRGLVAPFKITLDLEGWFGHKNNIRALQPSGKQWAPKWVFFLPDSPFIPHVVCDWPEDTVKMVTSLAVMRGKTVVVEWEL